jgi:hypothetical protein
MQSMSETPQSSVPPSPATPPAVLPADHSERLYLVAAWVAIIAGITLIAVVILKFTWLLVG